MKKEMSFIVILLALLLLVPGVIAPAIKVTIKGDRSNTAGEIESIAPTNAGFEPIIDCNIDNDGRVIVKNDCESENHCSSDNILWVDLTLKAAPNPQRPNIEITWSAIPNENYNEPTVTLSDNCKSNDHTKCTIELRCLRDMGGGVYTPAKGLSYTINAKFEKLNEPPTIKITEPQNEATFIEGGPTILIKAEASVKDGTISKVEFYNGASKIGEGVLKSGTTDQYTLDWPNVPAGSYSLTAKATDNKLETTTSAPVNIVVKAASCGDGEIQTYEVNDVKIIEECEFNPSSTTANCPIPPESCNLPGTKDECKCSRDYCVGACTYKVSGIGNCENGQQEVTLIKGDGCTIEQCTETRKMIVPCERRVAMLPFFSFSQVISAITLTIIIYLFALFRKKK